MWHVQIEEVIIGGQFIQTSRLSKRIDFSEDWTSRTLGVILNLRKLLLLNNSTLTAWRDFLIYQWFLIGHNVKLFTPLHVVLVRLIEVVNEDIPWIFLQPVSPSFKTFRCISLRGALSVSTNGEFYPFVFQAHLVFTNAGCAFTCGICVIIFSPLMLLAQGKYESGSTLWFLIMRCKL